MNDFSPFPIKDWYALGSLVAQLGFPGRSGLVCAQFSPNNQGVSGAGWRAAEALHHVGSR